MKKYAIIAALLLVGAGCFGPAPTRKIGTDLNEPQAACTLEAKQCSDGTFVGRVPPTCEFAPCPPEVKCPADLKTCPDGTKSARLPPSCDFAPCPGDTRTCRDMCGDGQCAEIVCEAVGCPCAETAASCPQDCGGGRAIPPSECPDVCAAVCGGQPEPEVPAGCPMPMCYCEPQER